MIMPLYDFVPQWIPWWMLFPAVLAGLTWLCPGNIDTNMRRRQWFLLYGRSIAVPIGIRAKKICANIGLQRSPPHIAIQKQVLGGVTPMRARFVPNVVLIACRSTNSWGVAVGGLGRWWNPRCDRHRHVGTGPSGRHDPHSDRLARRGRGQPERSPFEIRFGHLSRPADPDGDIAGRHVAGGERHGGGSDYHHSPQR